MEFGWINVFGAGIVVIMLIPNIIYAIKNKAERNLCTDQLANLIEQIGRYSCIVLMWVPLGVWKFGFASVGTMLLYLFGNGTLLLVYWNVYVIYLRRKTPAKALTLAVLSSCIFWLSGVLLRHWLLVGFSILFAVGHIYVTVSNITMFNEARE